MSTLTIRTLSAMASFDPAFADARAAGLTPGTVTALEGVWREHASTLEGLEPPAPPLDWLTGNVERLAEHGPPAGGAQAWEEVARAGERLAEDDPVAGALVAVLALAAWEGATGDAIYELPMGVRPNPGWRVFPLALGRALLRADAVWSAGPLAHEALDVLGAAYAAHVDPAIRALQQEYTAVLAGANRRIDEFSHELAYELRRTWSAGEPTFRPEVAALLWALGDAARAHAVAVADDPPAMTLLRFVVRESLRRLDTDPFVQHVWLQMKDRPPVDLRAHRVLFARMNTFFTAAPMHAYEAQFGQLSGSPSEAFARLLIAWFRGDPPEDAVAQTQMTAQLLFEFQPPPSFAARMAVLLALVLRRDDPGRWRELADSGVRALEAERRRGEDAGYDRALDLALAYLPGSAADRIDAVERHRAANLWYRLATAPPADRPDGDLREREDDLLARMRALHLVRLLPDLPLHYRRVTVSLGADGPPDTDDLLDPRRSVERLAGVQEQLAALIDEMESEAPAYAARRRDPTVDLEAFAARLAP